MGVPIIPSHSATVIITQGTLTMVAHTDVVFDHTLRLLWPEALRATPTVFVLSAGPPEGGGYRGQ